MEQIEKIEPLELESKINHYFEESLLSSNLFPQEMVNSITAAIDLLDEGKIRVAHFNKNSQEWKVNEWVKKAILLYFKINKMRVIESGEFNFFDKIPLKKWTGSEGVRVVPQALVRKGAYISSGAVLMPSYVNIGAYVGSGTMVDTWATVGSCAQIGSNVHLSGGVGIGGVFEPLQATPVIVEDNVFVGSRSIIVEGIIVKSGAVIGAGVTITASTKIIDATSKKETVYKGFVPEDSVVIPGTMNKKFTAGEFGVPVALIIGKRTKATDKKTSLNQALRDFEVCV